MKTLLYIWIILSFAMTSLCAHAQIKRISATRLNGQPTSAQNNSEKNKKNYEGDLNVFKHRVRDALMLYYYTSLRFATDEGTAPEEVAAFENQYLLSNASLIPEFPGIDNSSAHYTYTNYMLSMRSVFKKYIGNESEIEFNFPDINLKKGFFDDSGKGITIIAEYHVVAELNDRQILDVPSQVIVYYQNISMANKYRFVQIGMPYEQLHTDDNTQRTFISNKTRTVDRRLSPDDKLKKALYDFYHGNFTAALPVIEKYAAAGDVYALERLAICYKNGYGVKEDKNKANHYFNELYKIVHPLALTRKAWNKFQESKNDKEGQLDALKMAEKAAESNIPESLYVLALIHEGLNDYNMSPEIMELLQRSADMDEYGSHSSLSYLSELYKYQNKPKKSFEYLQKAYNISPFFYSADLSEYYLKGYCVDADLNKARLLASFSMAKKENNLAAYVLGECCLQIERDSVKALKWFLKSEEIENSFTSSPSDFNEKIGLLYYGLSHGENGDNMDKAKSYLKRISLSSKNPRVFYAMYDMLRFESYARSGELRFDYALKAAELGMKRADLYYTIGAEYFFGKVVKQDLAKAEKYLLDANDGKCYYFLSILYRGGQYGAEKKKQADYYLQKSKDLGYIPPLHVTRKMQNPNNN